MRPGFDLSPAPRTIPARALVVALALSGCAGDDQGASEATSAGSTTDASTTGTSDASTDATMTASTDATATTTTSTSTTSTSTTAGESTSTSTTSDTTTGPGIECDALPPAPIDPEIVTMVFDGSEDLAFDGLGHLAGKRGDEVILVDASDAVTPLASPVPKAYGLRYMLGGDLVVALPNDGKLLRITPAGAQSDLLTGLQGPNGVFPDLDGAVWVTEFSGSRVIRWNPDASVDVIVSGGDATSANGVVFDPDRGLLFYTNYQSGRIARVSIDDQGQPGAVTTVTVIPGSPDGIILDACGNLYAVDQGNSDLYRLHLDELGNSLGGPELLAELPTNVANPQFGRGDGFDPMSLYLAGNPGVLYRVAVGVPGIEIP